MSDFSKQQLAAILSAVDCQFRNPASKAEALAAIQRRAAAIGCTLDDILSAGDKLLDGGLSDAEFHAALRASAAAAEGQDPAEEAEPAEDDAPAAEEAEAAEDDAPAAEENDPVEAAPEAQEDDAPGEAVDAPAKLPTVRDLLLAACRRAAAVLAEYDIEAETQQTLRAAIDRAVGRPGAAQARRERVRRPDGQGPREGTKEAMVIEMLRGEAGTTIAAIADATGWRQHTVRGFFAGALKKRLGLVVSSEKAIGGVARVYRLEA